VRGRQARLIIEHIINRFAAHFMVSLFRLSNAIVAVSNKFRAQGFLAGQELRQPR